ncbi:MAG: hypothetical protein ACYDA1_01910, partial [Vulcanimicrobiaceae bacterium]
MLVLLPMGLGLLLISMVDTYLIYASQDLRLALYICPIIGSCTLLAAVFQNRGYLAELGKMVGDLRSISLVRVLIFGALLAALLSPTLIAGFPTTPYRIGIDQVGYGETSQFLAEGGTLTKAKSNLLSQLQTKNYNLAKAQNIRSLNFETYVDSEFLLKALRWGFPGTIATLTELTGSTHVFNIEFLLLIFSCALLLALAYSVLRTTFSLPAIVALAIMAALALNCNFLNTYYEGQYAEIFTSPYIFLVFILFLEAREKNTARTTARSAVKPILLSGFLMAGIFSAYNEAVVIICALGYGIMLLDFFLYRKTSQRGMLVFIVGFLVGAILLLPISYKWLVYSSANLQGLARAGFWQPHWASPAEILGFLDMYRQTGYQIVSRSIPNEIVNIIISGLLVALFFRFFLRERNLDKSFWIAPVALVLLAYVKSHLVDGILNYPYMKVY